MKIIKHSEDTNDTLKFECTHCHCEFECETGEYYEETTISSVSYPPSHKFIASCPECHKICYTWKRDRIASCSVTFSKNDNLTTYTSVEGLKNV